MRPARKRLLLAATALTTSMLGAACEKKKPIRYANDKRPTYAPPDAGTPDAPADAGEAPTPEPTTR